jgi:hypothetical protein
MSRNSFWADYEIRDLTDTKQELYYIRSEVFVAVDIYTAVFRIMVPRNLVP